MKISIFKRDTISKLNPSWKLKLGYLIRVGPSKVRFGYTHTLCFTFQKEIKILFEPTLALSCIITSSVCLNPDKMGFLYFHTLWTTFSPLENLLYYSECMASWPDDIDYIQAPDHLGQSLCHHATFIKHHITDTTFYFLALLQYTTVG